MKLFTVEEANALLPVVQKHIRQVQRAHRTISQMQTAARQASAQAESGGGGMIGGADYVRACALFAEHTEAVNQLGVQIKDFSRGLIDFPCLRDGRVVLLCWQMGEVGELRWWHDVEAGFAGRQPL